MAIRELTPDLKELARKNVNEDPRRTPKDIAAIKEWLKKQPHIIAREDDEWILLFLRGCKFSLERTKEKIERYYTYRTLLPEFFDNRDPLLPELQELISLGAIIPLPKPDKLGRAIMLQRIAKVDPKKHKIVDNVKFNFINMDALLLEDERAVIGGSVFIMDAQGLSIDHMTQMTPLLMKKCMAYFQDGYPIRPQAVHYINTSGLFETMFGMIKPLMKKKLQERLHIHGQKIEKLYEHVPRELLPSDYGGELPSCDEIGEQWRKTIENKRQWFLDDPKYRTDEKKRPGKPKTTSEEFGVEGSFRTLQID